MRSIVKPILLFSLCASAFLLTSCKQPPNTQQKVQQDVQNEVVVDQKNLCEVNDWQHDVTSAACHPGQKIVFLPSSFGNEQLPIIFAAVNCDLRYTVALTNGGVTCIFAPITPKPAESSAPAASLKGN